MSYLYKYNKYKSKYLLLKKYIANGGGSFDENIYNFILNKKNNIFSNLSFKEALLLAYMGASNIDTINEYKMIFNNNNLNELISKYRSLNDELINSKAVGIANSIWLNNLKPTSKYFNQAKEIGDIKSLPFDKIEDTINFWIKKKTHGMITNIGPINTQSLLIIINVIYFKAKWKNAFDIKNTVEKPFYIQQNKQINCQFMILNNDTCHYLENDQGTFLGKKYENDYMMIIILPKNNDPLILPDNKLIEYYDQFYEDNVYIEIPKFTIESKHDLIPLLHKLNFKNILIQPHENICDDNKNLFINEIIQKSKIIVNEEGTEAAATTMVILKAVSMLKNTKKFIANRPFTYYILYEVNKTVIFNGIFYGNNSNPNTD